MDRDKQLHPPEKVPSIQRSRGCPINLFPQTKPATCTERLRERCLERGSPNHSSMHSNLSVNSKPKNMLLMIRNGDRPSQSLRAETRGLDSKSDSFPVTVTHGLKRGCRGSRQTDIERITIPSSTNSFHHPHAVQPRQTCTYQRQEKTGKHDRHPMGFHTSPQEGGFVQDLAKPRKISQYPSPSRRKHARYRTKTNGALTKSNGPR